MKKTNKKIRCGFSVLSRVLLILGVLILVLSCEKEQLLGGDKDEHGCIPSAGYQWCEFTQKCQRFWEEPCSPYYCEKDEDCEIKNIGNCCGYYPACVNKNYEPDLEAIQKECDEKGMMSVCGFPVINACECTDSLCKGIMK